MPVPKKVIAMSPLFFGPAFSTKLPRSPAEKPRNRMASENVQVVCPSENPISFMMGRVKTLQA